MKRALLQLCLIGFASYCVSAQPALPNAGVALPYPPMASSPVAIFRMLLATNELGRSQWIAKWKPAQREYLEGKIAEFTILSAEQRETRLQTLQLRWYLPQLMKMDSTERNTRLATVAEPDRTLLASKLRTWDIQMPQFKQDLLDLNEVIGIVMFPSSGAGGENVLRTLPPQRQEELRRQFAQLHRMPEDRRERVLANFQLYFGFTPDEKTKTLKRLTSTERAQMQQTLAPFEILPPSLRQQALVGFKKFAELSLVERAAFLQSAERWQKMNEAEREKWRQMAARIQKVRILLPPPPIPMPPAIGAAPNPFPLVATN